MTSGFAVLAVLALIIFNTYAGARDGVFFSMYCLVRNTLAFFCAMTFCQPMALVFSALLSDKHPAPEYFVAISFAILLGGVFAFGRWLKVKYCLPGVHCPQWVDRIWGGTAGFLNAVVISGAVLILWSLFPFARYIPADYGRVRIEPSVLDTGAAMLTYYDYAAGRLGGNTPFLLEDEPLVEDLNNNGRADPNDAFRDVNGNRRWDRGWLWRYRNYADILLRQLEPIEIGTPPEEES